MYKKYQFPLNIFIVFEKITPVIYTSEVLTSNHYFCFIPNKWLYSINLFLKKELFLNFSFLTEHSAVDTFKYNEILPEINLIYNKNRHILYYTYYIFYTKIRLTIVLSGNNNKFVPSLDKLFINTN
jgi:hypothetical protein